MSAWEKFRGEATGVLGRWVLTLWARSCRIKVLGRAEYESARREGKPVIHLIWHGRLMVAPYFFRKRGIAALVSPSRDGEILTQIVSRWGYRVIRGSSSHSIVRAWVEMKNELRRGGELIIIPDGPRGPSRILKAGAVKLARETGAFLVPFSFSASKRKFLKSWDEFLLFYPFSKIVAIYGKPIAVLPGQDEESLEKERRRVEQTLTALDAEADSFFVKA